MDLRIVNTCNNNCLYCLEQSYRKKNNFLDKEEIFSVIKKNRNEKIISFYGGNSLLHPFLSDIIEYCNNNGFESIGLISNTYSIDNEKLQNLIKKGLTGIGFYFNSFNLSIHDTLVNGGISLPELINNIELIKKSGINYKVIIHLNGLNIKTIYKDLVILNKKYQVKNIEFINYFPFDRPYDKYKNLLEYNYNDNRHFINLLFGSIKKLGLNVRFFKFSIDFFGIFKDYYDFEVTIKNQIGIEDIKRLSGKDLFCYNDGRCNNCFIKDICL
ncbi:radical SAM protein [Candidatus Gracilibacteria bacterium]|nr:radical SAM protein [Candidatus Gracilibacteria bacterium]